VYQEKPNQKEMSSGQILVGPLIIAIMKLPSNDKKAIIFHKEV
jgi:hypothetical protein